MAIYLDITTNRPFTIVDLVSFARGCSKSMANRLLLSGCIEIDGRVVINPKTVMDWSFDGIY